MIRINLLPQAKRAVRAAGPSGSSQVWAAIYMVGVVVWGAILAVIYFSYDGTLQEQLSANNALDTQIQALRTKSARLEEVQSQLEASHSLEQVVGELNKARTGPVRAMMELSRILSVCPPDRPNCDDVGPTIDAQQLEQLRRDNPYANFNRSWDVRRLWITHFEEEGRACRMRGLGRSNEDVAEFLRRLALSELFDDVMLQRTEAARDNQTDLELIGFELTCQVIY
ncbi:MAG: PilN domain-containing protein [Myxococcota bacterium]